MNVSSTDPEEGDPKGKVSLAGRRAQCGPWDTGRARYTGRQTPLRDQPQIHNINQEGKRQTPCDIVENPEEPRLCPQS